jgi:CheY-like chemotaxis protein
MAGKRLPNSGNAIANLTLMDLQMPEMNGFDAIAAIRGEFPEARIV